MTTRTRRKRSSKKSKKRKSRKSSSHKNTPPKLKKPAQARVEVEPLSDLSDLRFYNVQTLGDLRHHEAWIGLWPIFDITDDPASVLFWTGIAPSFLDHHKNSPPPPLILTTLVVGSCLSVLAAGYWYIPGWILLDALYTLIACELYNIFWHVRTLRRLNDVHYSKKREVVPHVLRDSWLQYILNDNMLGGYLTALQGREKTLSFGFLKRNVAYHLFCEKEHHLLPLAEQEACDDFVHAVSDHLDANPHHGHRVCFETPFSGDDSLQDTFGDGPLDAIYKPFGWYAGVYGLQKLFRLWARTRGFTFSRGSSRPSKSGLDLLHRIKDPTFKTLVFIHGLGFGCTSYIYFLSKLLAFEELNLVFVELPNISYTSSEIPHPRTENVARSLMDGLSAIGVERAVFVSHSYGTVIHNVTRYLFPEVVTRSIFIDPVCFMYHQPVCARMMSITLPELLNQRDKETTFAQRVVGAMSYMIVFKDIFTQFVMKRTFFMEHSLGEMTERDYIVLAEFDEITPAAAIRQYVKDHHSPVHVHWRYNVGHGEVMFAPDFYVDLVKQVVELA